MSPLLYNYLIYYEFYSPHLGQWMRGNLTVTLPHPIGIDDLSEVFSRIRYQRMIGKEDVNIINIIPLAMSEADNGSDGKH